MVEGVLLAMERGAPRLHGAGGCREEACLHYPQDASGCRVEEFPPVRGSTYTLCRGRRKMGSVYFCVYFMCMSSSKAGPWSLPSYYWKAVGIFQNRAGPSSQHAFPQATPDLRRELCLPFSSPLTPSHLPYTVLATFLPFLGSVFFCFLSQLLFAYSKTH